MPERGTLSIEKAKKLINYQPTWILKKDILNILVGTRVSFHH